MNKLIEVYDVFPWVKECEDAAEYMLISDVEGKTYFNIKSNKKEMPCGGLKRRYINPSAICSVCDNCIADDTGIVYPYCEILMQSGERFYFPDYWEFAEKERGGE